MRLTEEEYNYITSFNITYLNYDVESEEDSDYTEYEIGSETSDTLTETTENSDSPDVIMSYNHDNIIETDNDAFADISDIELNVLPYKEPYKEPYKDSYIIICIVCNNRTYIRKSIPYDYNMEKCSSCYWKGNKKPKKSKSKSKGVYNELAINDDDKCQLCCINKKNGGFVHGTTTHNMACYSCCRKQYNRRNPCPKCRRPIEKIVRIYSC